MGKLLRVLIVEDSEDDVLLLLRELQRGGYDVEFERVETARAMQSTLTQKDWDLILSDYSLPEFNAPQALELLKGSGLDLPFIIISGTIGEETAVAALKAGANDFLVKGKFARLGPAIERELREAESRRERRRAEEQLRYQAYLLSNVNDAIIASDENYLVTYWNHAAESLYGWSAEETIGKFGPDITKTEFPNLDADEMRRQIRDTGFWRGEVTQAKKDGTRFPCEISSLLLRNETGGIAGYVSMNHDITERKRAEEALRESEERFSKAFYQSPIGIVMTDLADNTVRDVNDALLKMSGLTHEQIVGQNVLQLNIQVDAKVSAEINKELWERGGFQNKEIQLKLPSGETRYILDSGALITIAGRPHNLGLLVDITERKRAEEQAQLQIQRLRSLRAIDIAISSSFNLSLTLNILLDQVVTQLNVDAAAILLFDLTSRDLEYGASRGFLTTTIQEARVRIGEGYAGKAILERHMIHVPNLMEATAELPRLFLLMVKDEGFKDYYCLPLVVKGEAKGVLEIFHRSALSESLEWLDFLETLAGQAAIAIEDATLFENLQRSNQELFQAYDATIEGWSGAMDLRDKETEGHTERVTDLTLNLARAMNIDAAELVHMRRGALLHDMGKLGVPDNILLKPGKLTVEEWETMRKHPQFAYNMLSDIQYLKPALDIPYCHHEKWDGTGYPRHLKGEEIPLAARLFAVVDVWDALTSDRPYRKAWSPEEAAQYIREQAGKHFDPHVVNVFLNMIAQR